MSAGHVKVNNRDLPRLHPNIVNVGSKSCTGHGTACAATLGRRHGCRDVGPADGADLTPPAAASELALPADGRLEYFQQKWTPLLLPGLDRDRQRDARVDLIEAGALR